MYYIYVYAGSQCETYFVLYVEIKSLKSSGLVNKRDNMK